DPEALPLSYTAAFSGINRAEILEIAHQLREREGYQFEGFSDWSVAQVIAHTGLSTEQASRSMERLGTEPILWQDTEALWERFSVALDGAGVRHVKGGRFIHLMGNTDKAMGLNRVVARYRENQPDVDWHVVALGDSPN